MKVEIEKSRRKTITLQFKDLNTLLVKAPLRVSEKSILQFIESKRLWIEKTRAKMQEKDNFKNTFDFENNIYLLGEKQSASDLNLIGDLSKYREDSLLIYDKIYKDYAKKFLTLRAEEISKQIGLGFNQIKISRSIRYWGCYTKNGIMHLNYKLIVLPEKEIDYVIIHELCHSKFFNHSPQFWALVQSFCPDFKARKKELDAFSFLLEK